MSKLRFLIAPSNYVLTATADSLNVGGVSAPDRFELEFTGAPPAAFPFGLSVGDLVLLDLLDSGRDFSGGGAASTLREFYVTNPNLQPARDAIEFSWFPFRRLVLPNAPVAPSPAYDIYINNPIFTEFSPLLSDFNLTYTKEEDEVFFRRSFGGEFTVYKTADYELLKGLKDSNFPYSIFVKIERFCSEEGFKEVFEGFFNIFDCEFDLDRCAVKFELKASDRYDRILNKEAFEINLKEIPTAQRVEADFLGQTYGEGLTLLDCLSLLLSKYAPEVRAIESVFFNLNNPADFVYTSTVAANLNLVENLLIFDPSDFRFPTATSPATITNVTLTQILSALKLLFNCKWFITEEGVFRIEHLEYFEQSGTDLSAADLVIKNRPKINAASLPVARRFKIKQALNNDYLRGYLINFDDELKQIEGGGAVEEKTANEVTTDAAWFKDLFDAVITTPEPEINAGFFLYNPLLSQTAGVFDQNIFPLRFSKLLEAFFTFDVVGRSFVSRSAAVGGSEINEENYEELEDIQSRRPRFLIEGAIFKNCCEDFSPLFPVLITIDGATVEARITGAAILNLKTDTLTADLLIN